MTMMMMLITTKAEYRELLGNIHVIIIISDKIYKKRYENKQIIGTLQTIVSGKSPSHVWPQGQVYETILGESITTQTCVTQHGKNKKATTTTTRKGVAITVGVGYQIDS